SGLTIGQGSIGHGIREAGRLAARSQERSGGDARHPRWRVALRGGPRVFDLRPGRGSPGNDNTALYGACGRVRPLGPSVLDRLSLARCARFIDWRRLYGSLGSSSDLGARPTCEMDRPRNERVRLLRWSWYRADRIAGPPTLVGAVSAHRAVALMC